MIDEKYWPHPLRYLAEEKISEADYIVVAERSSPFGKDSIVQRFTAIVQPDIAEKIIRTNGAIGHEVDLFGPPPRFSIFGGSIEPKGLEPLIVSWDAGNKKVFVPDQGFLATYNLVPRTIRSDRGDVVYWDNVEKPDVEVIKSAMVSEYYYELKSNAYVLIKREYLEDYATQRDCVLLEVYYANNSEKVVKQDLDILSDANAKEIKLPGRLIDIRIDEKNNSNLSAQIWGVRRLFLPGKSPITEGRWDYGNLIWPGIDGPVDKITARKLGLEYVYVEDEVLLPYEQDPEQYSIHPESGAVSYKGQWSVSYCDRITRNMIRLEIKKLYEGCPPEVVEHWYKHAVAPPTGDIPTLLSQPNVATRSKSIVYSFMEVGELLSRIAQKLDHKYTYSSKDFVGLTKAKIDYYGWWNNAQIIPITNSYSIHIGKDMFLNRCKRLNSLITEGFNQKNLRKLLTNLGCQQEKLTRLGSLKLLDILIQLSIISNRTGLLFIDESSEIIRRYNQTIASLEKGQFLDTPINILFILYDLRIEDAHRGNDLNSLLERLGTDNPSVTGGMGLELDKLYDSIADALRSTIKILKDAEQ